MNIKKIIIINLLLTATLHSFGQLTLTRVISDNFDCGDPNSTATITFEVSGGAPPYDFAWSNGSLDSLNVIDQPGDYRVTITDFFNRVRNRRFTIARPLDFTIRSISFTPANCGEDNGAVLFRVDGGAEPFILNDDMGNMSTGFRFGGLAQGDYNLTVTDDTGCTQDTVVTVDQIEELTINGSQTNNKCFGEESGVLDLSITGGIKPYQIEWSDGVRQEDRNNLPAGFYNFVVIDDLGCIRQREFEITQGPEITITPAITPNICNGGSNASIEITADNGSAPYTYLWQDGSTTDRVENLTAGQYCVTVTDSRDCPSERCFLVSDPSAIEISGEVINAGCGGTADGSIAIQVSNGLPPYSYFWSGESGFSSNERSLTNLESGRYTLQVTDNFGCSNFREFVVQGLGSLNLDATPSNPSCFEGSTGSVEVESLNGTSPFIYQWQGPSGFTSNNQNLSNIPAGEYYLSVGDARGCKKDSFLVVLEEPEPLTLLDSIINPLCKGDQNGAIFTKVEGGQPPYRYFFNGEESPVRYKAPLGPGNYLIEVEDANGCRQSTPSVELTALSSLELDLGPDINVWLGQSIFLNAEVNDAVITDVLWTGSNTDYIDCIDCYETAINRIDKSLSYTLSVKDEHGCTAEDDIKIFLDQFNFIEVPTAFSPNNDGQNDLLNVFGNKGSVVDEIVIFDKFGAVVYDENDLEVNDRDLGWDGRINGEDALQGTYIWKVKATFVDGEKKSFTGTTTLLR